ncbi:MAG: hypothetical protein P4L16_06450 [Chlamydiales bacterium]|nr:hypothetical protein [Chlamydiales bacterium]
MSYSFFYVKQNIRLLKSLQAGDKLIVLKGGQLKKSTSLKESCLSYLQRKKVQECICYSFQVFCHEMKNSLNLNTLCNIYKRTIMHANDALSAIKRHPIYFVVESEIEAMIKEYYKASLMQEEVIRSMTIAVAKQEDTFLVLDAKEALLSGKIPKKPSMGVSGSYIMYGIKRAIAGIFKPFDEEISGPNNPLKVSYRGSLGKRTSCYHTIVGCGIHREVAASLVDNMLFLHLVPKTCYAEFSHKCFFESGEGRYLKKPKTKMGSFQEYQAGYKHVLEISKRGLEGIPVDQLHRLMILDCIIGNMDRNQGNLLTNGRALVAIDHALSFPSEHPENVHSPLIELPQLQVPFFSSLKEKILTIDVESLACYLKRHCFFDYRELERMKERIALLQEGARLGALPAKIMKLSVKEHLDRLKNRSSDLQSTARALY